VWCGKSQDELLNYSLID